MSAHKHFAGDEHDFEPERGLPEPLPPGERLLWQGSPDWRALAVRSFHLRKLALYFGIILAVRGTTVIAQGGSPADGALAVLWLLPAAALGLALVALLAWLSARTTVYTITDKRVVMRIGIALSLAFNLPFNKITGAGLLAQRDGSGNIPITLAPAEKIAYLHLWPHARPWRVARPEPMLCSVPDAARVAETLSQAWSAATGIAAARSVDAAAAARPAAQRSPSLAASH